MTYKSDNQPRQNNEHNEDDIRLEKRVVEQLDSAEHALSQDVVNDIAQARVQAVQKARMAKAQKQYKGHASSLPWRLPALVLGTPAAVAFVALLLVSYGPNKAIPELPVGVILGDVAVDDLALINDMEFTQDLEFADWLAQQNEEVLL